MHDGEPFYITLPSDAPSTRLVNTASEWITKMKQPITLTGKWEVALVELQYVNTIFTILEDCSFGLLIDKGDSGTEIHSIFIPPGNYQKAEDLLSLIRHQIPVLPSFKASPEEPMISAGTKAFTIEYISDIDRRLVIEVPTTRIMFSFKEEKSRHLLQILGFDFPWFSHDWLAQSPGQFPDLKKPRVAYLKAARNLGDKPSDIRIHVADRSVNSILGVQSIFVYCDIADYSIVGDSSAQILRNVPIKGSCGEIVTERFDAPHYVPILPSCFDTVHVILANDSGHNIKFGVGKSIAKLHCRPRRLF